MFESRGLEKEPDFHSGAAFDQRVDGSVATQTVRFSIGGAALESEAYEIDLNDKNADKLHKAWDLFVGAARRGGRAPGSTRRTSSASGSAAEIRIWAESNGWTVRVRDGAPADVRSAYDAARWADRRPPDAA